MATGDRKVTDWEERDERGERGKKLKEKRKRNTQPPKNLCGKIEKETAKLFFGERASSSGRAGLSLRCLAGPTLANQSTHKWETCPRMYSPATLRSQSLGKSHH